MPELAEVAYACGKWKTGIGKFIKEVYANPSSRVYRDLSQMDVVSECFLDSVETNGWAYTLE